MVVGAAVLLVAPDELLVGAAVVVVVGVGTKPLRRLANPFNTSWILLRLAIMLSSCLATAVCPLLIAWLSWVCRDARVSLSGLCRD